MQYENYTVKVESLQKITIQEVTKYKITLLGILSKKKNF